MNLNLKKDYILNKYNIKDPPCNNCIVSCICDYMCGLLATSALDSLRENPELVSLSNIEVRNMNQKEKEI